MKIRPVAVMSGPPIEKAAPPIFDSGHLAAGPSSPSGRVQAIWPDDRSTASSVAHGGLVQGAPHGESTGTTTAQYAEPACGKSGLSGPHCARGTSFTDSATWVVATTIRLLTGSIAGEPQSLPPNVEGLITEPWSDGG